VSKARNPGSNVKSHAHGASQLSLSASIPPTVIRPKECSNDQVSPNPYCARSSRNDARIILGTPRAIISEHRAPSSRNTARHHLGTLRAITSEHCAPSPRNLQATLYLDNFSAREIAETLGISEGAVSTRVTRLRDMLRKVMDTE
jgi:hypothetical protein